MIIPRPAIGAPPSLIARHRSTMLSRHDVGLWVNTARGRGPDVDNGSARRPVTPSGPGSSGPAVDDTCTRNPRLTRAKTTTSTIHRIYYSNCRDSDIIMNKESCEIPM